MFMSGTGVTGGARVVARGVARRARGAGRFAVALSADTRHLVRGQPHTALALARAIAGDRRDPALLPAIDEALAHRRTTGLLTLRAGTLEHGGRADGGPRDAGGRSRRAAARRARSADRDAGGAPARDWTRRGCRTRGRAAAHRAGEPAARPAHPEELRAGALVGLHDPDDAQPARPAGGRLEPHRRHGDRLAARGRRHDRRAGRRRWRASPTTGWIAAPATTRPRSPTTGARATTPRPSRRWSASCGPPSSTRTPATAAASMRCRARAARVVRDPGRLRGPRPVRGRLVLGPGPGSRLGALRTPPRPGDADPPRRGRRPRDLGGPGRRDGGPRHPAGEDRPAAQRHRPRGARRARTATRASARGWASMGSSSWATSATSTTGARASTS